MLGGRLIRVERLKISGVVLASLVLAGSAGATFCRATSGAVTAGVTSMSGRRWLRLV